MMLRKISNWSLSNLMPSNSRGINLTNDFNQCITLHFQHTITYSTTIIKWSSIENSLYRCRTPIEIEFISLRWQARKSICEKLSICVLRIVKNSLYQFPLKLLLLLRWKCVALKISPIFFNLKNFHSTSWIYLVVNWNRVNYLYV